MQTNPTSFNWGFLIQWVLLNTFGMAFSIPIIGLIFLFINNGFDLSTAATALLLLIIGILLGVYQWLILRSQIKDSAWWILTSFIGMVVGFIVITSTHLSLSILDVHEIGKSLLTGTILGATVGAAQWLFLRQRVSHAGLWLLGSIIGGTLGLTWGFNSISGATFDSPLGVGAALIGVVFILMMTYSIITGLLLIWLLQQPLPKSQ